MTTSTAGALTMGELTDDLKIRATYWTQPAKSGPSEPQGACTVSGQGYTQHSGLSAEAQPGYW